jgi:hypothetical protein
VRWHVNGVQYTQGLVTASFTLTEDTTCIAEYEAPYLLDVQSTPVVGVDITGGTVEQTGTTNYQVSLAQDTSVSLTAPLVFNSGGQDYQFVRWTVNGYNVTAGLQTINFTLSTNVTCIAQYLRPVLTVMSGPPPSVGITGTVPGTTTYAQQLDYNTWVVLTAPGATRYNSIDYVFTRWWIGGTAITQGLSTINFLLTANTTCYAEYSGTSGTFFRTGVSRSSLSSALAIDGPPEVMSGESATYRALLSGADGKKQEVTLTSRWRVSDDTWCTVSQGVLAVAGDLSADTSVVLTASYVDEDGAAHEASVNVLLTPQDL